MVEPNADYFLQPIRALWYRLDRKNFEAATERALSHDAILKQFAPYFRCESVVYKGSPGALLILHNWALRIPQSWKSWYARPLMAFDRAWERLPTKLPFNFFLAKWVMYWGKEGRAPIHKDQFRVYRLRIFLEAGPTSH
jgi:hypothetical protein